MCMYVLEWLHKHIYIYFVYMHEIPLNLYWTLDSGITIPELSNRILCWELAANMQLTWCVSQDETKNHVDSGTSFWDMLWPTLRGVIQMLQKSRVLVVCVPSWSLSPCTQRLDDKQTYFGIHGSCLSLETQRPEWYWYASLGDSLTGSRRNSGLWVIHNHRPSGLSTKWASPQAFTYPNSHPESDSAESSQEVGVASRKWQVSISFYISPKSTQSSNSSPISSTFMVSTCWLWDWKL